MSIKGCLADGKCPPYGKLSIIGRRREMEDAISIVPFFVSLTCDARGACCSNELQSQSVSALHFFGVYDGHGGAQASAFCKKRLHYALAEEVTRISSHVEDGKLRNVDNWKSMWEEAMAASFLKLDKEVGGVCPNGACTDLSSLSTCCSDTIAPGTVGSTAMVAIVSPSQIVVGNCGDSRAVLCRAGKTIVLSNDHKPERHDERMRVEAAGGRVVNWDGYRVAGLLSVSRAIGDRYLKPYVIAEPEVTCTERADEDECLILATDGLWDVVNNDLACEVARKFLKTARRKLNSMDKHSKEDAPTTTVAALLTKLALGRGSTDNISVVVIDLKPRN